MIELPTAIPDFEVLLALEPEELGAKMLFLRKRTEPMFNLATLRGELWSQSLCDRPQYSPNLAAFPMKFTVEIVDRLQIFHMRRDGGGAHSRQFPGLGELGL